MYDYVIIFFQDLHQYNCFVTTGKIISTIHGVFKDIGDRPSVSEMRQKYWTLKWCMFAITKISFFTRPLSGVESISGSSVYLSIYLFVCLSSLLILFLQTLSSRNIPQSTLITQPLPRLTSGVELCVNLTFLKPLLVPHHPPCQC